MARQLKYDILFESTTLQNVVEQTGRELQTNVRSGKYAVRKAQQNYANAAKLGNPQQIAAAQKNLDRAQSNLQNAKTDFSSSDYARNSPISSRLGTLTGRQKLGVAAGGLAATYAASKLAKRLAKKKRTTEDYE